ncbi:hypothetical protein APX70_00203, partial [Pseudomonas syringae pv. maculicola]
FCELTRAVATANGRPGFQPLNKQYREPHENRSGLLMHVQGVWPQAVGRES